MLTWNDGQLPTMSDTFTLTAALKRPFLDNSFCEMACSREMVGKCILCQPPTQRVSYSFLHKISNRSDHSTLHGLCGTLYYHMSVTLLVVSTPLLFHVPSMGNPLQGCCSLPFGPDGQDFPVFSGVGAVRSGGLLPSVLMLCSLLIKLKASVP